MQIAQNMPIPASWIEFPVRNGKVRCEVKHTASCRAIVVVTMGSARYRSHPITFRLAEQLAASQISTVLTDLLTPFELSEYRYRFDTERICTRLELLIRYLRNTSAYHDLPVGLFGGGTGANAVLTTAARMPGQIKAVVCMDGLAGMEDSPLDHVTTPTLFVHHQEDAGLAMNSEQAVQRVRGWCMVEVMKKTPVQRHNEETEPMTAWFRRFLLQRNMRMIQQQPIKIHA